MYPLCTGGRLSTKIVMRSLKNDIVIIKFLKKYIYNGHFYISEKHFQLKNDKNNEWIKGNHRALVWTKIPNNRNAKFLLMEKLQWTYNTISYFHLKLMTHPQINRNWLTEDFPDFTIFEKCYVTFDATTWALV